MEALLYQSVQARLRCNDTKSQNLNGLRQKIIKPSPLCKKRCRIVGVSGGGSELK